MCDDFYGEFDGDYDGDPEGYGDDGFGELMEKLDVSIRIIWA